MAYAFVKKVMPAHLRLLGLVIALLPACDRESMSTSRTSPASPSIVSSKPTSFDEAMVKLSQRSSAPFALEVKSAEPGKAHKGLPGDNRREEMRKFRLPKLHRGIPIKELPPTDMPDSKMIPNVAKGPANKTRIITGHESFSLFFVHPLFASV